MFDSCVLIDAIQKTPDRYDKIGPYVSEAEAGRLQIVISVLSLAEVCYLEERQAVGAPLQEQVRQIEQWLNSSFIVARNVDRLIARRAARLREPGAFGLKTPDAIIVATALLYHVPQLLTFDAAKLLKLDGKVGGKPLLRIVEPDGRLGPLFTKHNDSEKKIEEAGAEG